MEWQITIDGKVYDGIIGDRNYDSNNIIADNEPVADSLNKIANYLNTEDFVEKRYYPAWQDFTVVGTEYYLTLDQNATSNFTIDNLNRVATDILDFSVINPTNRNLMYKSGSLLNINSNVVRVLSFDSMTGKVTLNFTPKNTFRINYLCQYANNEVPIGKKLEVENTEITVQNSDDASEIAYNNSTSALTSTDVQSAIDELDSEKLDKGTYVGTAQDLYDAKQDVLVSGTNIKTINGQSVLGSGDITIEAGGSGSSTFTGTASIDIGGVKVGDSWNNAPISDVVNAIINPELFPAFVNPSFSFTSTVNGFREVGSVTDITFNVNFSRGSITPQYSAENNYRSGLPTTYNYSGPVGSEAKANNTLTDTKTITGYSIAIGSNTFSCSVDYSIGTQPKSSKGNDYNTPLPAGTLAAKSVTITGVYPVYNGIGTLSKIPLQAHGTAIVVDAPADMNVGGNRFTIHYPNVWSAKTPVVQQENELSKAWDNQNMSDYSITTIDKNGVSYKQVKYVGAGIGARKLRLVF